MALRPPSSFLGTVTLSNGRDLLGDEILSEQAASLGHMGKKAEKAVAALRAFDAAPVPAADRDALVRAAADAVWAYLVQRELSGLRNTREVVREMAIPAEVMNRLGAR